MQSILSSGCRLLLLVLLLAGAAAAQAEAVKRALLVGVGNYADSRLNLKGPPHDVAVLRETLVLHGGFDDGNVTVLVDGQATRRRILAAIEALGRASHAGDFVLIYLSGHGTSAFDPTSRLLQLPHHSGAFVPADFAVSGTPAERLASLVVGARDLLPRLRAIDDKQVRGLILVDSCYSQNTSRALHAPAATVYRTIPGSLAAGLDDPAFDAADPVVPPYPYRHLATLTASSKNEKAEDLQSHRTLDGHPHGAFTDSLLRTLQQMGSADADHDGTISNGELFAAVRARMSAAGYPQSPQILPLRGEDTGGLQDQAALPGRRQPAAAESEPEAGAPLRVEVQGSLPQVTAAIRRSAGLVLANAAPDLRVVQADGAIRLLTAAGDLVFTGDNDATLIHALRQQHWVQQLLRTPNAAQRFKVDVRMDGYCGETFEAGDVLGFSTRMDATAHLLLVDAAPDGTLRVLYPYYRRELAAVRGGRSVPVGNIHVTPPFGIDYVVAAGFIRPPSLYDERLLNGAAFAPGTAGHRDLAALLEAADDPNLGRQVVRVVTVPRSAGGSPGCEG